MLILGLVSIITAILMFGYKDNKIVRTGFLLFIFLTSLLFQILVIARYIDLGVTSKIDIESNKNLVFVVGQAATIYFNCPPLLLMIFNEVINFWKNREFKNKHTKICM